MRMKSGHLNECRRKVSELPNIFKTPDTKRVMSLGFSWRTDQSMSAFGWDLEGYGREFTI